MTTAKRIAVSLQVSGGIAVIHGVLGSGAHDDPVRFAVEISAMPGLIVALAVAPSIFATSPAVMFGVNVLFYTLLTYFILAIRDGWRSDT